MSNSPFEVLDFDSTFFKVRFTKRIVLHEKRCNKFNLPLLLKIDDTGKNTRESKSQIYILKQKNPQFNCRSAGFCNMC